MKIAIIDYNAGNVQSVLFALERLGQAAFLTKDAAAIEGADKVIFPGVGEARSTMSYLKTLGLDRVIPRLRQPVLGICLGMQLLCEHSEENDTPCLGIIPQQVRRFRPQGQLHKVPHVGWNNIQFTPHPLFDQLPDPAFVYFVHSYYVEMGSYTTSTCDYVLPFSASLQKDNFYATQFHPEKSGSIGTQILQNFLAI
ncbi:MAG: imidazole glycerol phosphate synthase subunit HisH [Bacteroidota bacterium]